MERSLKSKKIFALIVTTISGLSLLYSVFIVDNNRILKQEVLVTKRKPELRSKLAHRGGRQYWIEFEFLNQYGIYYKLSGSGLKYALYHDIMNDIKADDTLLINSGQGKKIYAILFKGKNYVDESKALKWEDENNRFTIFCRAVICIACLPIFFFKRQPKFWHSGFEFDFSFRFLFALIFIIALCFYFYCNGFEYLNGVDKTMFGNHHVNASSLFETTPN